MAMEGTHIRFARDLLAQSLLSVTDLTAYYSGAVYPDSRYVTGIPRSQTHENQCPQDPFMSGLTDFEKGWATHLVYDVLASIEKRTALATIPNEYREDDWAFHSAIKLVEDQQSVLLLGSDTQILQTLILTERPRNEDLEKMVQYYQNLREAYGSNGTFEDYHATSLKWGMPRTRVDRLIELSKIFSEDPAVVEVIRLIYPTVFNRYVLRSIHT